MLKSLPSLLVLLVLGWPVVAQPPGPPDDPDSLMVIKAEKMVLMTQNDSALALLQQIKPEVQPEYVATLTRIAGKDNPSYRDYQSLQHHVMEHSQRQAAALGDLVLNEVPSPDPKSPVDLVYVRLLQATTNSSLNIGEMGQAQELHERLEDYVGRYDPEDAMTRRAALRLMLYDIVQLLIQYKQNEGKELSQQLIATARELKDTNMIIAGNFSLSDFLVNERALDRYIEVSRENLELEKNWPEKSEYYIANLVHLVNALIFRDGPSDEVWGLLDLMYNQPGGRLETYSLYAQLLTVVPEGDPKRTQLYQRFGVKNIFELAERLGYLGYKQLDPNGFYHILDELSKVLENDGHMAEAMQFTRDAMSQIRHTYTSELTSSLADVETRQEVRAKQAEVENQKEKAKLEEEKATLYTVIAGLAGGLLLLVLIALVRRDRQAKLLAKQSAEIAGQRDEIAEREQEKALLLKEVHHRVKNNFQIVSSLLELQTKGIEDEKARELAEEGKNRVKSMALIHQRLYQNDDLLIYFDEYIGKLVDEIAAMYGDDRQADVTMNIPKIGFDIDTAIPLGLIVNELVTNAFKYGFDESERKLNLTIDQAEDGSYELTVTDNGKGLDPGFDVAKAKSLGLRLVRRLSKQLQGTFSHSREGGSSFVVHFKDTSARAALN